MATAFMGGQAGFDEAGTPTSQILPKAIVPSPVAPAVPGITAKLPTGAPPPPPATPEQMASDPAAMQKLGASGIADIPKLQGQQLAFGQASANEAVDVPATGYVEIPVI